MTLMDQSDNSSAHPNIQKVKENERIFIRTESIFNVIEKLIPLYSAEYVWKEFI